MILILACGSPDPLAEGPGPSTSTLLLVGDVSLARGIGEVAVHAPHSIFEGVRHQVRAADLALGNLESPLTNLAAVDGGSLSLIADPSTAGLLAAAGFDAFALANNHAGDGGPETVLDTLAALTDVGLLGVGAGPDVETASRHQLFELGQITIAALAFDVTGRGPTAGDGTPGVTQWSDRSLDAVALARRSADVVVVSLHGGAEYLWGPDDTISSIAASLGALGVDVVWGHGPHVVHPVIVTDPDGDGRPTVVATSLGNFLFDRSLPGTERGRMLEVMVGKRGVVAFRLGTTSIERGRVRFDGWEPPSGGASFIHGSWWHTQGISDLPATDPLPEPLLASAAERVGGEIVHAARGDLDDDGTDEVVASFLRPYAPAALHDLLPDVPWTDPSGRTAHVGVFAGENSAPRWIASAMAHPVADLAVCDGSIVVGYSDFDDSGYVGVGAWLWTGFGWDESITLPHERTLGCLDVDGDGRSDPVAIASGPGRTLASSRDR
jgi:poly-gamma-glutamate synthesis protein (capsule biosynthesis protein)